MFFIIKVNNQKIYGILVAINLSIIYIMFFISITGVIPQLTYVIILIPLDIIIIYSVIKISKNTEVFSTNLAIKFLFFILSFPLAFLHWIFYLLAVIGLACSIGHFMFDPEKYSKTLKVSKLISKGEKDRAIKAAEELVRTNPHNVIHYTNLGSTLFNRKDYSKAIEVYKKGLKSNPNSREILFCLGICYFIQEKYSEAVEYFESALTAEDFKFPLGIHFNVGFRGNVVNIESEIKVGLSYCYFYTHNFEKFHDVTEAVLNQNISEPIILMDYAEFYFKMGEFQKS